MTTFKSGAFVQQCFSAHPMSLQVKSVAGADRIVVMCTCCDLRHRVFIGNLTTPTDLGGDTTPTLELFARCATQHAGELHLSAVDVVADAVKFRCSMCRRMYDGIGAQFETYRKDG
jgi:hypothetical protein